MFQSCKHTSPLLQKETDTISSKAVVHYISITEEMVFSKSGQCLFSPNMQKFGRPMENCLPTYSYNNLYLPETLQHQKVLETIFILVLSTLKDISEKRLSDRGQKTFSIKDQVVKIIKFACHAISIATTLLLKHLAAIDNNKSSVRIQLHLQMLKFKFYVILQVMKYIPF